MVRRTKFKIKIQIQIQNNKIFQRRNQKVHLPVDFSCSSPFPFSKSLKLVIPFCVYCKFASLLSIFSLISIFFLLTSDLSLFDSPYVEFAFCFLSPDHVTLSSWVPSFLIKSPGMCHVYCAHLFGLFFYLLHWAWILDFFCLGLHLIWIESDGPISGLICVFFSFYFDKKTLFVGSESDG